MTRKTSNRFPPRAWQRVVRSAREHAADHASQWAALGSIGDRIGCTDKTLRGWVRQAEHGQGLQAGPTGGAGKRIKAPARENRVRHLANEGPCEASVHLHGGAQPPIAAMIAFIDDHRAACGLGPRSGSEAIRPAHVACRALFVSIEEDRLRRGVLSPRAVGPA
ncbi:hypothetical protein M0638_22125 [Roseomonas sp. NAR14]|uniref:Transposase n=1 Tax=Roseomonas acroporae TaxID=2937791 RepID=A0A9X2BXC7_9PROT|nr:hypothetical protein [Roseomonas acroporae]MCK8787076.1 hypothetical protein [Roseomonas acroporae]